MFLEFFCDVLHNKNVLRLSAAACAPGSLRTKSLETVATRIVTGTTALFCENCWLASAGGLGCGRAVVLGGKLTICE